MTAESRRAPPFAFVSRGDKYRLPDSNESCLSKPQRFFDSRLAPPNGAPSLESRVLGAAASLVQWLPIVSALEKQQSKATHGASWSGSA